MWMETTTRNQTSNNRWIIDFARTGNSLKRARVCRKLSLDIVDSDGIMGVTCNDVGEEVVLVLL